STNLGAGLIIERVIWKAKNRSVSLSDAFENGWLTLEQAEQLLNEAFQWYLDNNVLVSDYSPPHLVIAEADNGELFLSMVDGIGGRRFGIKYLLQRWIPVLARHKTRQVFRQALER